MIVFLSCINMDAYSSRWENIRDFDQDGLSIEDGDCDDLDSMVNPSADEVCDGIDNDCDGVVDVDAINRELWGVDLDLDGYAGEETVELCARDTIQYVDLFGDCDDLDASVYPEALETWDDAFLDNDCDFALAEVSYDIERIFRMSGSAADGFESSEPIILSEFDIFGFAQPGSSQHWSFERSGDSVERYSGRGMFGVMGVGFQNRLGIEFWGRNGNGEEEHWLSFYSEFEILSEQILPSFTTKLYVPSFQISSLEVSNKREYLAIQMDFEIYVIDEIPTEDIDIWNFGSFVEFQEPLEQISWGSDENGTPILLGKIDEERHVFFRKEGVSWQLFYEFHEPCEELIGVEDNTYVCRDGREVRSYIFDSHMQLQDSKQYEQAVVDLFTVSIMESVEPFVLLEEEDNEGSISYSFFNDEISLRSSLSQGNLSGKSRLKWSGEDEFALWDQLNKELFMFSIPSN